MENEFVTYILYSEKYDTTRHGGLQRKASEKFGALSF